MDPWIIWLILAVVLGVAEIFTLTALGLLGGAALLTAVAAVGLPLPSSSSCSRRLRRRARLVRPIAIRHIKQPPAQRFGVAALVGKSAYVPGR